MICAQTRTIVSTHIGGGVMHVDGEVERSIVRISTEFEECFGEIKAVVGDRDGCRRDAVTVDGLEVRAALDEGTDDILVTVAYCEHQGGEASRRVVRILPGGNRGYVCLHI